MKKAIWLVALSLFLPLTALATSGACSGHGGVSCVAGSDADGSVICVDGWRNSSVSYSSMAMCQEYTAPATYTPPPTPIAEPTPAIVEPAPIKTPVVEPAVAPTVAPKVIQPPLPKKVIEKKPKEVKATTTAATTSPKVEVAPVAQAVKQITPTVPTEHKKGFWARLFSFWF